MNYIHRDENALYYECGYSNDNAIYIKVGSEAYFITDSRYEIEAKEAVRGASVVITRDIVAKSAKILKKSKIKKCLIDPNEWSLYQYEKLSSSGITFKPKLAMSHKKRIIKTSKEIKILNKAAKIGAKAFDKCADFFENIGIGSSEKVLNFEAEIILRDSGEYPLSFEPIVAVSENAAKPHAIPTDRVLKRGDLLLMDAGIKYKRYCSDRTRTAFVGDSLEFSYRQKFKDKRVQKAYDIVLKAHDKAISKARSGMRAWEIDRIARDVIEKAGFGKYFVHSTGHGVGLDIHEMPYISSKSKTVIEDSMVFTIEPGIYIPDKFGIRIEDMVVMKKGRAKILGV